MLEHLSPSQKGDFAQAAIVTELVRLGHEVLQPISGACRYDLAVAIGHQFYRVQCKLAQIDKRHATECVRFWASSSRKQRNGKWTKLEYSTDCDLLVAYCPDNGQAYAIAASEAPLTQVSLLLGQAQNGQTAGIRFAEDHALATVLAEIAEGC